MKKIGLVALFALLLAGCDDGGEKKAQENLRKAEAALEKENFNEAKLQIDSVRILYPKAFEARKQGVKLMQRVDLKEQQKSLVYLDSMMVLKQAQLDSVKGNFVLEKDTAYQEVLSHPDGREERRPFILARTSERAGGNVSYLYLLCRRPFASHSGESECGGYFCRNSRFERQL